MLISRINSIAENPTIFIASSFYSIGKNMFMLTFSKPTTFRICGRTFDGFAI